MKKDKKTTKAYITKGAFDGGSNFREIARVLTKTGKTINHATARNLMVSRIKKLLQSVTSKLTGDSLPAETVADLMKNQETYQMISDLLHKVYTTNPDHGQQIQSEGSSLHD